MDKHIKSKLDNVLKAECDYVMKNEKDIKEKCKKMDTLFNLKKVLDNYDELQPLLKEFFNKKAEKERFER